MNNTPKKEKKKERANDEERDELKKTNSAGSTEAHDNRDTEFGSIFLRRSPKKNRKNNSKNRKNNSVRTPKKVTYLQEKPNLLRNCGCQDMIWPRTAC